MSEPKLWRRPIQVSTTIHANVIAPKILIIIGKYIESNTSLDYEEKEIKLGRHRYLVKCSVSKKMHPTYHFIVELKDE